MAFSTVNKVLEEVDSPINGKIRVVRTLGLGTYLQAEGLTQSGGIVDGFWRRLLGKVKKKKPEVENCLILGLGGGSAAMRVKKLWPQAAVIGVDVDPLMIELGRKYLGLTGVNVVIEDASNFTRDARKKSQKYDLILIDTYLGSSYPPEFERDDFLIRVKGLLTGSGLAVFNRLYYAEKRPAAMKFGARLEKVFARVDYVFPEANVMFVCSSVSSTSL